MNTKEKEALRQELYEYLENSVPEMKNKIDALLNDEHINFDGIDGQRAPAKIIMNALLHDMARRFEPPVSLKKERKKVKEIYAKI